MFCSSCGKELAAESKFCNVCGNKVTLSAEVTTHSAPSAESNVITKPCPKPSDKWAWVLACVPLASAIFLAIFFTIAHIRNGAYDSVYLSLLDTRISYRAIISYFFLLIVYTVCILFDRKELNRNGINIGNWVWFGLPIMPVFVSVYMFVRAAKANKGYGYSFLWLATFVTGSFVMGILLNAEFSYRVLNVII